MRKLKAFGYGIIVFQVLTLVALALTVQTILGVLSNVFAGEAFKMNMETDEASGEMRFTLDANPRNSGVLGVRMTFELGILSQDGKCFARNSTSVYIEPGSQRPFSLVLFVPAEVAKSNNLKADQGHMEVVFGIRTLGDLVGLRNIMRIGRGG